jgi:hypothetical protein
MERTYSSYSFTTSALDGGEWSQSRPGRALAPGKGHPVPIVQEGGWTLEPVWTQRLEEKDSRLCRGSNLDRPVVQSVAKHYTDWATRLTKLINAYVNMRGSYCPLYLRCCNYKVSISNFHCSSTFIQYYSNSTPAIKNVIFLCYS